MRDADACNGASAFTSPRRSCVELTVKNELCRVQVLHFVLEAVRAEAFNPATLFLFGSYTIGKERLFLEVARILKRKVRLCYC